MDSIVLLVGGLPNEMSWEFHIYICHMVEGERWWIAALGQEVIHIRCASNGIEI